MTPDIQSLVESVKPVRDILGEPVIADSHQLQKGIWRTKVESAESRIAQLEAELAEEKRKVELVIAARSLADAIAALTTPSERKVGE